MDKEQIQAWEDSELYFEVSEELKPIAVALNWEWCMCNWRLNNNPMDTQATRISLELARNYFSGALDDLKSAHRYMSEVPKFANSNV